ncbi:MAG TPA: hypothetical protein VKT77_11545 [Chthonomonadaceae bacterium]|nr:hypothetical protein [Chthonomonadaceae bacterium]
MLTGSNDRGAAFGRRRLLALGLAAAAAFAAAALAGCGGGGGGGGGHGGGGTPVLVTGRVLRAETGAPPSSAATVTIGGVSVTTAADGTFSFNPPSSGTSATIASTGTMTRTIAIKLSTTGTNNLGDIFLSDTGYTANVNGRVVASVNGVLTPVGGATVTIGNVTGTTATDGTFTLMGLPVDLGNVSGVVGKVTAAGFEDKLITDANLQFPLVAGANPIGDLLIAQPSGSTPLPPFTISGVVKVGSTAQSGVSVQIVQQGSSTILGTTTTDSTGTYTFWVVPGAYTITATNGAAMQSVNVTLVKLDAPVAAPTITF